MYQFATNIYIRTDVAIKYVPICDELQIHTYLLRICMHLQNMYQFTTNR